MIQSVGSKNIMIMSTERELREKRDIDYKKLHNDSDSDLDEQEDDPDEEIKRIKKELQEVKYQRKKLQKVKKKEKLLKELEEQKKQLKNEKDKDKGEFVKVKKNVKNDVVKVKKNIKDVEELTLNKLRSDNVIKTKAKNKAKKILELESSDTDSTCSSSNSSSSDSSSSSSSSHNSVKKIKKYKSKSMRKSGNYDKPSNEVVKKQLWPQSKLQYEYAGSKMSFEDLEFNLFVAGELEIISGKTNQ
jgi:hypothetical protein